jgi:hypothetical protein
MIATIAFLLLAHIIQASPTQPPPVKADQGAPFLIGVLRRDGVVSPFASFDGNDWDASWPSDLSSVEVPISLDAVPRKWWGKSGPVEQLTAWVDGSHRGAFRLTRPTVMRLMCSSHVGLTSDYRSLQPAPPLLVQPYPKDGVAVSGTQPVEPIESVEPGSAEWVRAEALVRQPFDKAEDRAIDAFTAWNHPVRRDERRKLPIEIEALYRAPMDEPGWTAYYVEAIRRYAPGPDDDGCGLMTSTSGWMIAGKENDGKEKLTLAAHVTYCDRRGVTYMLPLGLLKVRDRIYWAYQLSGHGRESYGIVRPTPRAIRQEVFYSSRSCPLF